MFNYVKFGVFQKCLVSIVPNSVVTGKAALSHFRVHNGYIILNMCVDVNRQYIKLLD